VGLVAFAAALAWPAVVGAAEVPLTVVEGCGDARAAGILKDELRVRLEGEADRPGGWRLSWRPVASGCALVLEDTGEVLSIPLAPGASEDALREAVVRVAWVVTMEEPRRVAETVEVEARPEAAAGVEPSVVVEASSGSAWWEGVFVGAESTWVLSRAGAVTTGGGHVGLGFGERWSAALRVQGSLGPMRPVELESGEGAEERRMVLGGAEVGVDVVRAGRFGLTGYGALGGGWMLERSSHGGPPEMGMTSGEPRPAFEEVQGIGFGEVGARARLGLGWGFGLEGGLGYRQAFAGRSAPALADMWSGPTMSVGLSFQWDELTRGTP